MKDILKKLVRGEISIEEAEGSLRVLAVEEVGELAKFDVGRELRHGVPEVVIAEGKKPKAVNAIVSKVMARKGSVIVSRADENHISKLEKLIAANTWGTDRTGSGTLAIKAEDKERVLTGGRVGIVTAGTSDIPIAEEARIMAVEMGCEVFTAYDVGVAGIHRLISPLKAMIAVDVDVMIVVAGREGALPTLMAGMVDIPLIAVPTSYGYGLGGKGVAALMAMLQSCSLGMAVVNIDGGIPAGAIAAQIANRAAKFRSIEMKKKRK